MNLLQELRTRNVLKVGIVYAVASWILLQLTEMVSGLLSLPEWTPQLALIILIVGFVPAMVVAWTFELTPEGVKLDKDVVRAEPSRPKKGRKLDFAIVGALALALAFYIWESGYRQKKAEVESLAATGGEPEEVAREVVASGIEPNSIAVLPFENRSAEAADIYFTDGIHDDLLTQLSRIDAFRVISRTSVLEYRDSQKNLQEIAGELGVNNIMRGSVQKFGDRVRINVQLIDAWTEDHLWAEIYDRQLTTSNLFDIQSEIARAIADSLKATLSESDLAGMNEVPTDSVESYELYLQARRFGREETRNGYQSALELYQQALDLDPAFKLVWIGLARAHITNYWSYGGDPADVARAREAIDRAKTIDASFPELYMAEGFYWYWGHLDYERAIYNLDRAVALMPGSSEAHMWHGWASRRSGLWEQGLESMQRSLRLDPRVSFNWAELGGTYLFLHRFGEAGGALLQALEVNPDDYWGKTLLADLVLMESGDLEAALELTLGADGSDEYGYFEQFMDTHILAGRYQEALDAARNLDDALEIQRNLIMLREIWAAQLQFFMGRQDEARQAANAALFRLRGLAERLGDDYRIDMAHAMLSPILGESAQQLEGRMQRSMASRPVDKIEEIRFQLRYARINAMAGRTAESIALLEPLFRPPSETTIHTVGLDPAFDRIRGDPEFVAMLGRYR